jgi:starch phosphorylase
MARQSDPDRCEMFDPTSLSPASVIYDIGETLFYHFGKLPQTASARNIYEALALAVRKRLWHRWINTALEYTEEKSRVVCYLSAEYLLGPHLAKNLFNLGLLTELRAALAAKGRDLDQLLAQEVEPGLGNGGLGRLAACFLESLATLEIPAIGYGIRYEFGIFQQEIRDGWQVERTDKWLHFDNPWEVHRPEIAYDIKLGGYTQNSWAADGRLQVHWIPARVVRGVAYDTPILGYQVNTCNLLRLWSAEAVESFDFEAFNQGDYYEAVEEKVVSENLTKILYPNDEPLAGKRLRLEQQYFFCSCALQDMVRIHLLMQPSFDTFPDHWTVQLNDTHPAIAVAELMRLLVDEHGLDWEQAWAITQGVFCYTNHTLLPEALEKWPLPLFAQVLPRHLEIIFEINRRFLAEVRRRFPGADDMAARLSLIDESGEKYVRMANLACVGSRAINGVAALHAELVRSTLLKDFADLWPEKFHNVTNGVDHRRFLALANPRLATLISAIIGSGWIRDLREIRALEPYAEDPACRQAWQEIRRANKEELAAVIQAETGVAVDPGSLFDVLVKRIHEYKRQHLLVLYIIALYLRLKKDPGLEMTPRTFIFAGKAAPGYFLAKLIIKLINAVGAVVNADKDVGERLKVVFLPNFNVKNAMRIYPAADLSEQISLAGKEASGTGNMKFALNGALTIGTLDGANVEIRQEVGPENFFLFGLDVAAVQQLQAKGYHPRQYYDHNPTLREVIDCIASGYFAGGDRELFRPLVANLLEQDPFLVGADFASYMARQEEISQIFLDRPRWTKMSILTTARMGKFSADRAIREYCEKIWHLGPQPVELRELSLQDLHEFI